MTGTLATTIHTDNRSDFHEADFSLSDSKHTPTPLMVSSDLLLTLSSTPLSLSPDADFLVPSPYFASHGANFVACTASSLRRVSTFVQQRPFPGWFHNQPANRKILIDWMDRICTRMQFSGTTLSLAVMLLDTISSSVDEMTLNTPRLSLSCLTLASKLREPQNAFLKAESIFDFFGCSISMEDIYKSERFAFAQLQFNLNKTTTAEYLCRFFSHGFVTSGELRQLDKGSDPDQLVAQLELMGLDISYQILASTATNSFSCDQVAAAILCFLRGQVGLQSWPKSLKRSTGFRQSDLDDCITIVAGLLETFEVNLHSTVTQNTFTREYLQHQPKSWPTSSEGPGNAQAAAVIRDPVPTQTLREVQTDQSSRHRPSYSVYGAPMSHRSHNPPILPKQSGLKRTKR
jgi:hypothetical protein